MDTVQRAWHRPRCQPAAVRSGSAGARWEGGLAAGPGGSQNSIPAHFSPRMIPFRILEVSARAGGVQPPAGPQGPSGWGPSKTPGSPLLGSGLCLLPPFSLHLCPAPASFPSICLSVRVPLLRPLLHTPLFSSLPPTLFVTLLSFYHNPE